MKRVFTLALAAGAATLTAWAAAAQPVQIAPKASLRLAAASEAQAGAIALQPGAVVLSTETRPTKAVRLSVESQRRPGGTPASFKPTDILFGIEVDNGTAYCGLVAQGRSGLHTQCVRDLNQDGLMDVSYLTRNARLFGPYFDGRLYQLRPMAPTAFTEADTSALPAISMRLIYKGLASSGHEFTLEAAGVSVTTLTCAPEGASDGTCEMAGHLFAIEGGSTIRLTGAASDPTALLPTQRDFKARGGA